MCYLNDTFSERTDDGFKNQTDENHHVMQTILIRNPCLNLVLVVSLYYMHFILQAAMKKKMLVGTWIF